VDVAASLSLAARKMGWTKPQIVPERILRIKNGKHPVVEWYSDVPFVPNSVELDGSVRTALVTGPNMAGKSTFLRQTAIYRFVGAHGKFCASSGSCCSLNQENICSHGCC